MDICLFVFFSCLVDVSDILEVNELEEVVGIILCEVGMGFIDYGVVLIIFYNDYWLFIDCWMIVLIFGDGCFNYMNFCFDIFWEFDGYVKCIVWFNLEVEL